MAMKSQSTMAELVINPACHSDWQGLATRLECLVLHVSKLSYAAKPPHKLANGKTTGSSSLQGVAGSWQVERHAYCLPWWLSQEQEVAILNPLTSGRTVKERLAAQHTLDNGPGGSNGQQDDWLLASQAQWVTTDTDSASTRTETIRR